MLRCDIVSTLNLHSGMCLLFLSKARKSEKIKFKPILKLGVSETHSPGLCLRVWSRSLEHGPGAETLPGARSRRQPGGAPAGLAHAGSPGRRSPTPVPPSGGVT